MPLALASPPDRALVASYLPAQLLQPGPYGLAWWQWLAIPVLLIVAAIVGKVLGYLTRVLLARLSQRTKTKWDDALLERLSAPITWLWALGAAYVLLPGLELPGAAEARGTQLLRTATVAVFFWAGLKAADLGFQALAETPTAVSHGLGHGLLPMLRKATKIAIGAMAVIAVLTDLGYPVATLLAGLGIGGLAVALAAQKTVENLFGSVSITVDQPFRVGDYVRVEGGTAGTVEYVGLRSTRIRTIDRTVITIPNGKLADQRIETFAVRDRIRLGCTLGLVREAKAAQVRQVVDGIRAALGGHPRAWPEGQSVRFTGIGESSLDVEVNVWFATADWDEFQAIRQDLLLRFLEIVEQAGTSLAYPTRTVQLGGTVTTAERRSP